MTQRGFELEMSSINRNMLDEIIEAASGQKSGKIILGFSDKINHDVIADEREEHTPSVYEASMA